MTLGSRLKRAREARDIKTKRELSELTGLSEASISKLEGNQQDAKASTLNLLNEILDINLNWLITGKGEMFKTTIPHYDSFKELLMGEYDLSESQSLILIDIVANNTKKDIIELWGKATQGDKSSISRLKDILRGLEMASDITQS